MGTHFVEKEMYSSTKEGPISITLTLVARALRGQQQPLPALQHAALRALPAARRDPGGGGNAREALRQQVRRLLRVRPAVGLDWVRARGEEISSPCISYFVHFIHSTPLPRTVWRRKARR